MAWLREVEPRSNENLTGEDWKTVLNLCDKVHDDEGEMGFYALLMLVSRRGER